MMYETLRSALLAGLAGQDVRQLAAAVLADVIAGHNGIAAVRHPLGFLCLPVERAGERGVCVHLWTDRMPQAMPTTSTTHAHSWDLLSCVLFGSLYNELVDVAEERGRPTHRVFEVGSRPDGDEIRRTGQLVRGRRCRRNLHHTGDIYALPAGVFHRTVPVGEVATIALGSGHPDAVDRVLGALDTPTHRVPRARCGREETVHAATMIASRLAEVPAPRHREDRCEHRSC